MNDSHNSDQRLHALDAVRAFALLLGVAFHAMLSFMPRWPPGLWATVDNSPSAFLSDAAFVAHIFRMSLFFLIAGFFARMLHSKLGTRGFWSNRAKRIVVPLIAGWIVLFPAITFVWIIGISKLFGGQLPPRPPMPAVPGAFPLTHLWFLYQLLLLYVAVLAVRALLVRLGWVRRLAPIIDSAVTGSVRWLVGAFVLGLPLAAALNALPMWFYWTGIPTPDNSLIPKIPACIGYGTAFVFGWLVNRSPSALQAMSQRWLPHLAIAVVATLFLLQTLHTTPMAMPGTTKISFALTFGVAVWSWVFAVTGLALRFLSGYSATRRYVADASYWIYLAHLPIVGAVQVWVGQWPLHWSLKYPFVLAVSLAILFVSYHYLVRPTFIGQLLNGRRHLRRAGSPSSSSSSLRNELPAYTATGPVAVMRGAVKRYGTIAALSGIDIELRRGELLAVLGPNGAGKSTAIALWLGLLEPDAGDVRLLGGSPLDVERRRQLGVMMQDVELAKELRVHELIALAASYYPNPMSVEEALTLTGTAPLAKRPYGKLSGGQKRQVQFALAVCGRPQVLFLDEPTVGLDVKAREALWASVRALLARGCSIVLTTHYLEEAEALADRVVVISKGRVVAAGSVDEMRALVGRRQISCESTLASDEVRRWPGVVDVTAAGARLTIISSDAEGVVRQLLAADSHLRRLEVREAGLAEAFNELTREAA